MARAGSRADRDARGSRPDVIALQEAWCDRGGQDQATRLAKALGYHGAYGGGAFLAEDWGTGSGLLSRWPIEHYEYREFPASAPDRWGGSALFGRIAGPRGPLSAFSVALTGRHMPVRYGKPRSDTSSRSRSRSRARRSRPSSAETSTRRPDSDERRMLTGRADTAAPGFALFDAWEMAGRRRAGTPGRATIPGPRRRYCRTGASTTSWSGQASPRRGRAMWSAARPRGPSRWTASSHPDHYAVVADLRY